MERIYFAILRVFDKEDEMAGYSGYIISQGSFELESIKRGLITIEDIKERGIQTVCCMDSYNEVKRCFRIAGIFHCVFCGSDDCMSVEDCEKRSGRSNKGR